MDTNMEHTKKLEPTYNESALKKAIVEKFSVDFKDVSFGMRSFEEITDYMFMVLDANTNPEHGSVGIFVKDSLNMICRAEGLTYTEKHINMEVLSMRYEGFLKKLYFMMYREDFKNKDGKPVTLTSIIYAIKSLRDLRYKPQSEYQQLFQKLLFVRNLRNIVVNYGYFGTEEEVEAATRSIIDMYLYAVGTNITELEMAGWNVDDFRQTDAVQDL